MLRNYLLTILRQIRKNRTYSSINIFGLAMAMATCLVIAHFVYYHLSFDKQYRHVDRIVRIETEAWREDVYQGMAPMASPLMSETLVKSSPLVEQRARFWSVDYRNNTLTYKRDEEILTYHEEGVYGVDKELFEIFDFPFLAGGPDRLDEPSTLVLTRASATKYFDKPQDAIGTKMEMSGNDGARTFEVVGVIEDLPDQTHFEFNVLFSMATRRVEMEQDREQWRDNDTWSYLLLSQPDAKTAVLAEIGRLYQEHQQERFAEYGYQINYHLTNIADIHLRSEVGSDFREPADPLLVYGLLGIAFIILLIAWINYLNLSLVKTMDRLKEIGIRKALGSRTQQITALFTAEATFINCFSFVLALTVAQIFAPFAEQLTGVSFSIAGAWEVVLTLLAVVLLGALLIGLYPAMMLRSFDSSAILTGTRQNQKVGGVGLRRFLVSLQFVITFALIAVTVTVYKQVTFMKSADLGIDIEHTMVIKAPPGDVRDGAKEQAQMFNSFKTALLQQTGIEKITNAGEIPGENIGWTTSISLKNAPKATAVQTGLISMGIDFLDFFELEPVAGRTLRQGDDPWSKGDVVINEKLAEMLGFETPEEAIGAELEGFWAPIQVRGVMKNHHHNSLHHDYTPIAYIISSWTEFYFVKLRVDRQLQASQRLEEYRRLVAMVEGHWQESFNGTNMDYYFLDQAFNQQYSSDEQFGQIFGTFATLAILIACMGLFGLTSFTLQQRTKEIGIRKVLGATMSELMTLLVRNYLVMLGIAYLIAMPIVWHFLSDWLATYHFRIELGLWLLAVPLLVVTTVSLGTILFRTLRSVRTNPVESLRYE